VRLVALRPGVPDEGYGKPSIFLDLNLVGSDTIHRETIRDLPFGGSG